MLLKFTAALILISLWGCTPNIMVYDSEKMEHDQVLKIRGVNLSKDPFDNKPTPDRVRVVDEDEIYVEVHKGRPTKGEMNIELQRWTAIAINKSNDFHCVTISWKLQDFEFESSLPDEFLIQPYQKLIVGQMRQTIWSFDGVGIALPPSGYADGINIREPNINPKTGVVSCEPDESGIQTIGDDD